MEETAAAHMADISSGAARVMCRFFDAVWTLCERIHLYPHTPASQAQKAVTLEHYEPFWNHFRQDKDTEGWSTED
jgi:hypothetical protein